MKNKIIAAIENKKTAENVNSVISLNDDIHNNDVLLQHWVLDLKKNNAFITALFIAVNKAKYTATILDIVETFLKNIYDSDQLASLLLDKLPATTLNNVFSHILDKRVPRERKTELLNHIIAILSKEDTKGAFRLKDLLVRLDENNRHKILSISQKDLALHYILVSKAHEYYKALATNRADDSNNLPSLWEKWIFTRDLLARFILTNPRGK